MVLACLEKQGYDNYEVLIIDNNSDDDTKEVVESFIPGFQGKLRYLFEKKQGKPYAINLGISEAQGEIIVLTDDDCTFESEYLGKVSQAFEQGGPTIGFIGGKILPRWVNCHKPDWFADIKSGWWYKEFFWGPLAILDYGEKPLLITEKFVDKFGKTLFYGANMAVRRELFLKIGGINVTKIIGEDTEFQLRFLRAGVRGFYAPEVKVYHKVTPKRLSTQYYYQWHFERGKMLEVEKDYIRKFYHPFGIQWALIGQTVKLWLNSIFTRSLTYRIYWRCHALFNLGQMIQIIQRNENAI